MNHDVAKKVNQLKYLIEGNDSWYISVWSNDEWIYFDHYANENGLPVGTKRIAQDTLASMDVGMATRGRRGEFPMDGE